MKVLIAGGGIGGLTLALALHDAGFDDIEVLEAAPEIKDLGVGINVLPHAARELAELGLLPRLGQAAVRTEELVYYTRRGQRIWGEPRGLAAGYLWPQLSIHRGTLLGVIHQAAVERLGAVRIHTGAAVKAIEPSENAVRVRCADGTTHEGDVLVGCDGVHSTVRSILYPNEGPPLWNGVTMWRGVTWAAPFLTGRTMVVAGHAKRRVVIYPIREEHGRCLINWVAEVKTADGRSMPRQDWDHAVDRAEVLSRFPDARFEWLDVPALIKATETVLQYPMVDRDPLPRWTFGRVTLLGDAAHPMYPIGSNGASQAVLDARILARELALRSTVEAALEAYEEQRRPATARIVLANRQVGPERAMELVEERAPDGFARIDDVISHEELEAISRHYKKLAGFDPAILNERPSYSARRVNR